MPAERAACRQARKIAFTEMGWAGIGAGKQPIGGPPGSPVAAQQFAQLRRQQRLPVFPPFAGTNPQHVAGAVDVGHFEAGDFTDSESRAIENRQHRAMAQIARRLQQSFDFLAAQNQRQLPFAPRKRNAFDGDLPVQGVGIEEAQCADHQHVGGRRYLLFFDQEQLVAANVLGTELIGWLAEVLGKLREWRTGTAGSWSENNGGSGDPPASVVEVGSQQNSFRCDHITNRHPAVKIPTLPELPRYFVRTTISRTPCRKALFNA